MRTNVLIPSLVLILNAILSGCVSGPSPQATAFSRAKPFMVALKAYHSDKGDYPQQLDDLRPRYLGMDVPSGDRKDALHYWQLDYQRIDRDSYRLYLDSSPCSQATFENGRLASAVGPNYK